MKLKYIIVSVIITVASGCVFGDGGKAGKPIVRRKRVAWFQERANHQGKGLTDDDLKSINDLQDESHFRRVLTPILIPRVPDTPGHAKVRKFIIDQMEGLQWTVEQDQFNAATPLGPKQFTNVIATLNPSATRHLVLACHYDSKITPTGFLGAVDSAVPCAMLINLAHTLQTSLHAHKKERNDLTLRFMFIDGEEAFKKWSATDSLYGARSLANKLYNTPFPPGNQEKSSELDRIDLFVLLDLLGTEDVGFYSFFPESENWYSRISSFEKRLISQHHISSKKTLFREQSYYNAGIEDDHVPFLRKGVPILHVISAPFPSVWHKMTDNLNALHFPSIKNLNTIFRAFVVDYLHLKL